MASRNSRNKAVQRGAKSKTSDAARTSARKTSGGPSRKPAFVDPGDAPAKKAAGAQELAESMMQNPTKAGEYGDAARKPQEGAHHEPREPSITGSTLSASAVTS